MAPAAWPLLQKGGAAAQTTRRRARLVSPFAFRCVIPSRTKFSGLPGPPSGRWSAALAVHELEAARMEQRPRRVDMRGHAPSPGAFELKPQRHRRIARRARLELERT
eukprot:270746-Chlamydomonas_euryale.AAC.1